MRWGSSFTKVIMKKLIKSTQDIFKFRKYKNTSKNSSNSSKSEINDRTKSLSQLYISLDDERDKKAIQLRAQKLEQANDIQNYQELEELAENFDFLRLREFLSSDNISYRFTLIDYKTSNPKQKVMTGFKTNFYFSRFIYWFISSIVCCFLSFSTLFLIISALITDFSLVVLMSVMVVVFAVLCMYCFDGATVSYTKKREIKIKKISQIKLPQLRLLSKEFEAMKLNPEIILSVNPGSLEIEIKLTKKVSRTWQY